MSEPLLQNTNNKYTIFPIKYNDIFKFYETHVKAIWFDNEVDMSNDLNDWKKLTGDEKFFIKHILAFFASSDGIIMENLSTNFCSEIQIAEARSFYSIQMFMENIHSITYSKLIETYVDSPVEKNKLFNAIESMPSIKKKAEWAKKWIDSDDGLATRLVAFIIVEGLFFSGAFAAIYWIKQKGILSGLCKSNDFIARDEGLHVEFGTLLYTKYIANKLSQEAITNLITEAVNIEKEFIIESLPCSLLGMNSEMMNTYIEFVANRLITHLGYTSPYDVKNPFGFMDCIALQNQNNFFDSKNTEYQKSTESIITDIKKINFSEDF